MVAEEHRSGLQVRRRSSLLSSRWRSLEEKMVDRGDKLRQAGQQEQLMELLQVKLSQNPSVRLTEEKRLVVGLVELTVSICAPHLWRSFYQ